MTPATGIKLTKLVDDTVTDANAVFKFTVELSSNNYDGIYRFVDANGTYELDGVNRFSFGGPVKPRGIDLHFLPVGTKL